MPSPSISEITPGLFIGSFEASKDIKTLMHHNIKAMVTLCHRRAWEWERPGNRMLVAEKDHLVIPCDDMPDEDMLAKFPRICDFIERHLQPPKPKLEDILSANPRRGMANGLVDWDTSGGYAKQNVLVHCNLGVSRSATVVAAYLMRKTHRSRTETLEVMKRKRKIGPNQSFLHQLDIWDEVGYEPWEDTKRIIPKEPYATWLQHIREQRNGTHGQLEERNKSWHQGDGWS